MSQGTSSESSPTEVPKRPDGSCLPEASPLPGLGGFAPVLPSLSLECGQERLGGGQGSAQGWAAGEVTAVCQLRSLWGHFELRREAAGEGVELRRALCWAHLMRSRGAAWMDPLRCLLHPQGLWLQLSAWGCSALCLCPSLLLLVPWLSMWHAWGCCSLGPLGAVLRYWRTVWSMSSWPAASPELIPSAFPGFGWKPPAG